MRKIESLDDIWWKSINVPPSDVSKILRNAITMFIFRERYGRIKSKRRFWKNDYVFVRELWHQDFFSSDRFIYEADHEYPYVAWNPPQQMPREAGRIFLKILKIERKRVHDLTIKEIKLNGFENRGEFIKHWDQTYWRKNDRYESNPMVKTYRFKRIFIKKITGGPVIKPRD